MFFFLNSTDNLQDFPQNFSWDFTSHLGNYRKLRGTYEIALLDVNFTGKSDQDLYVYCDIVEPNYMGGSYKQVLRRIKQARSAGFPFPYYVRVDTDVLSHIRIYIRDGTGKLPSFHSESLSCTLHLKHVSS